MQILNQQYSKQLDSLSREKLVKAWQNFVKRIANGKYNGNENEYWNSLDIRGIIGKRGYDKTEEVKKTDEQFRRTLIHTDVRNWKSGEPCTDDWWNFGYPNTLIGYLKDNFESDIRFKK